MKKIHKIILSMLITVAISFSAFSISALAVDENEEDFATRHSKVEPIWGSTRFGTRQVPKGGGMNILDNVMAYTLKDLDQLEQALVERGYILVNTPEKQITDEEFDLLYNNSNGDYTAIFSDYVHGFDFSQYPEYGIQNPKVYMYRPTLKDALNELKNNGCVSEDINDQLYLSSVVLNYRACYENERVGKIVNYYNENIPPWLKTTDESTGFILISSKINVKVLLEDKFRFIKDEIYIPKGKSVLIELPVGYYDFNAVNEKVNISLDEEALSHNNQITVLDTNTKDNPRVFDLTAFEEKYNIQPISDDEVNNPTYETSNITSVPVYSTIVKEPIPAEKAREIWKIVIIAIMALLTIGIIIAINIIKKKNNSDKE